MKKPKLFENQNEFQGSNFESHQDELVFLEELGFAINPYNKKIDDLKKIWDYADQINQEREDLNYPIDGLVVKLDNNVLASQLGVVGKTPRGWCAVKFAAEESTTKICGITWQVGRTGKITPVAELEATELAGTTVQRASLHNVAEVQEKALHYGDTLVVRKAGDIIPEVVNVLEKLRVHKEHKAAGTDSKGRFKIPSKCPSCSTKLIKSDTEIDLICPNLETCPAQVIGRLSYYTGRNLGNIVGLSEKIIQRFIKEYGISDIPDLYDLPWDQIKELEGFGAKSVENLQQAIEDSKEINEVKFLASLGIDGIGPEVAKLIIQQLHTKKNEKESN